jgi:hypothetical protein
VRKTVCSVLPFAAAADHITVAVADKEVVADSVRGTRQGARSLTRPTFDTKRAVGTATSVVSATVERGSTGVCWSCAFPKRLVRSHVENGAVKGTMTRTASQEAKNFDSTPLS